MDVPGASPSGKAPDLSGIAGSSEQRYVIVRKLASGGNATVYLGRVASKAGVERLVAIKACHPHLLDNPERRAAVLDEARVTARIRHPHVVSTLDVVERDDALLLVMEYVEGLTASELVRAHAHHDERLPIDVALRIVRDALLGLGAAHDLVGDDGKPLGVVHRDVSPQNILVGVDGFAKLADFGVFKAEGRSAPSTETGELKGKLGYVAPEVYAGEPVSQRADIYGMGVVLWELVAGRRLFEETSHAAVMYRALAGNIPSVRLAREDAPMEIDALLARALARDPTERFASAEDLARALERLPIAVASSQAVAACVRRARTKLGQDAPASHEIETPSEHVTPVVIAPPSRARTYVGRAVALAAFVAVAAGFALASRSAPAPMSASPAVSAIAPALAAPAASIAAPSSFAASTAPAPASEPELLPATKPDAGVARNAEKDKPRPLDRPHRAAHGKTAAPVGSAEPGPRRGVLFDPEEP